MPFSWKVGRRMDEKKTFSYIRIYNEIKGQILSGAFAPGMKLPTEAELQAAYGVSRITVKKAMDLLVDNALIERYPGKGTFIRDSSGAEASASQQEPERVPASDSKIIGMLMSGFSPAFGQDFLRGVAAETNRQGWCLMTGIGHSSTQEESELIQRMIRNGAKGLVVMPIHTESGINAGIVNCAMQNFPLVLADRYLDGLSLPYVGSDHADASFQIMQYLFSLGHTEIGLISSAPTTTAIFERENGYMKAYAMTPYHARPENLVYDICSTLPNHRTEESFRKDVERMKRYFHENPNVTALLCIDHTVMDVCETAAAELGLRIPEDLSLACFDASAQDPGQPPYTHIRQPEHEIGVQAVRMLLDVISGSSDAHAQRLLLPTELCIGASTGVPRR